MRVAEGPVGGLLGQQAGGGAGACAAQGHVDAGACAGGWQQWGGHGAWGGRADADGRHGDGGAAVGQGCADGGRDADLPGVAAHGNGQGGRAHGGADETGRAAGPAHAYAAIGGRGGRAGDAGRDVEADGVLCGAARRAGATV